MRQLKTQPSKKELQLNEAGVFGDEICNDRVVQGIPVERYYQSTWLTGNRWLTVNENKPGEI